MGLSEYGTNRSPLAQNAHSARIAIAENDKPQFWISLHEAAGDLPAAASDQLDGWED
jgi:hypothetical protein